MKFQFSVLSFSVFSVGVKPALAFALACMLASCANNSTNKSSQASKAPASKGERDITSWAASKGGAGYGQDDKGNWAPKDGARRSQFESKRGSAYSNKANAMFGGNQEYKVGDYKKTTFWGNKEYGGNKAYGGNTDGSRFRQSSRFAGSKAKESSSLWAKGDQKFKTSDFATKSANEQISKRLAKPSDAATDTRQRVYSQPEIIDWQEQRSMSVDQTKGLLGR